MQLALSRCNREVHTRVHEHVNELVPKELPSRCSTSSLQLLSKGCPLSAQAHSFNFSQKDALSVLNLVSNKLPSWCSNSSLQFVCSLQLQCARSATAAAAAAASANAANATLLMSGNSSAGV